MKFEECDNALHLKLKFKDFKTAMVFMNDVAVVAEQLDHHPDWSNTYNKVSISLTTHDEGNKVTEKDYELATAIVELAQKHSAKAL